MKIYLDNYKKINLETFYKDNGYDFKPIPDIIFTNIDNVKKYTNNLAQNKFKINFEQLIEDKKLDKDYAKIFSKTSGEEKVDGFNIFSYWSIDGFSDSNGRIKQNYIENSPEVDLTGGTKITITLIAYNDESPPLKPRNFYSLDDKDFILAKTKFNINFFHLPYIKIRDCFNESNCIIRSKEHIPQLNTHNFNKNDEIVFSHFIESNIYEFNDVNYIFINKNTGKTEVVPVDLEEIPTQNVYKIYKISKNFGVNPDFFSKGLNNKTTVTITIENPDLVSFSKFDVIIKDGEEVTKPTDITGTPDIKIRDTDTDSNFSFVNLILIVFVFVIFYFLYNKK